MLDSATTRRLAVMNSALRGTGAYFGPEHAEAFRRDLAPNLRLSRHSETTPGADTVLANGSMSSNQSGEGDIQQELIEADLVDCMGALDGQLFTATENPNAVFTA